MTRGRWDRARLGAPWLLSAILLLSGSGCKTIDGTYGFPPFYEVYDSPSTFQAGTGNEEMFRPFGSYETTQKGMHRLRFALPFLDFHWGPEKERYWVLPAFLYRSFPQPYGGYDTDWMLFPLVFSGSDPVHGSYFAVFPFGGRLKGLLGKDEIAFVLFPFYFQSRQRSKYSMHVLWPFYNTVWGGGWTGSRIWPFYGRYRAFTDSGMLRYDRRFILWPFYIRRQDDMHLKPVDFLFVCPFYGVRTSSRTESATYLWPLLVTTHDKRYDRRTYAGYIFPFRVAPGQTDIWPFFGTKKISRGTEVRGVVRRTYRHYILWPLERYEWASDGMDESTRFWLLPLFWHFHYIDKNTLKTRVESKVWPLFGYRRDGPEVTFDLFSPLWFQREAYDRYYTRWFSIFRYRWKAGLGGWELLYGALMYRREDACSETLFSILGGLLEVGTRGGRTVFRLLYIPWW